MHMHALLHAMCGTRTSMLRHQTGEGWQHNNLNPKLQIWQQTHGHILLLILRLYSKKHGAWDLTPELTIQLTLSHSQLHSQLSYPSSLQRKKGGVGKISPIGWAHLYLSANFQSQFFYVKKSTEEGERRADLMSLVDISWSMGIGQTHAWADFNPTPWLALTPIQVSELHNTNYCKLQLA